MNGMHGFASAPPINWRAVPRGCKTSPASSYSYLLCQSLTAMFCQNWWSPSWGDPTICICLSACLPSCRVSCPTIGMMRWSCTTTTRLGSHPAQVISRRWFGRAAPCWAVWLRHARHPSWGGQMEVPLSSAG